MKSITGRVPVIAAPQAHLVRLIRTTPFANTTISIKDAEGSAYVPRDHSLWLADGFGQTTQLTFSKVERNPKLDADAFRFMPPKGADVLEDK